MDDLIAQLQSYQDVLDSRYPAVEVEASLEAGAARPTTSVGGLRSHRLTYGIAFAFSIVVVGVVAAISALQSSPLSTVPVGNSFSVASTSPEMSIGSSTVPEPSSTTVVGVVTSTVPASSSSTVIRTPQSVAPIEGRIRAMLGVDGEMVVVALSGSTHDLTVLRCIDAACDQPVATVLAVGGTTVIEGQGLPTFEVSDMVIAHDRPVIALERADGAPAEVVFCVDRECTDITRLELPSTARSPRLVADLTGLVRVVYWDHSSHDLRLVTCLDPSCIGADRTIVASDAMLPTRPEVAITPEGRIVVGYEIETNADYSARVAICRDTRCTSVVHHTLGYGTEPRITDADGDAFLVWYRVGPLSSPEGDTDTAAMSALWDLVVATCDTAGCDEVRRIDAGPQLLGGWTDTTRLFPLHDGSVGAAYEQWSTERCRVLVRIEELDLATSEAIPLFEFGSSADFDVVSSADTATLVLTVNGKLRVVDLNTAEGSPVPGRPCSSE